MAKNGNVLLALSGNSPVPAAINSLLVQLDIHLPTDRSSVLIDHFNHDTTSSASSASDAHDVLVLNRPSPLRNDTKSYFSGSGGVLAVPRSTPQILGEGSALVAPILRAPETAYTYNPKEESLNPEDVSATGSQLTVVSAFQARNSARLVVLGSVEMLQDKWFSASVRSSSSGADGRDAVGTVNREFAQQLSSWVFFESGVLKVGKVEHHLAENNGSNPDDLNPGMYRIKNDVVCIPYISPP